MHRAEKRVLLRRLYLDLIGLPPTPIAAAFLSCRIPLRMPMRKTVDANCSPAPQYGERWGRHWMDVWRYSDWYGYGTAVRYSQRHIWRWRDWIVESLNQDKGYDRMIVEMLAGDEVAPNDPAGPGGHRLPGPKPLYLQPQRLAPGRGGPRGFGIPGDHPQMRSLPRPQVRSDLPRKSTTDSGPSSSLTTLEPTALQGRPTR